MLSCRTLLLKIAQQVEHAAMGVAALLHLPVYIQVAQVERTCKINHLMVSQG